MSEYTNPGPIENTIYVPTHEGIGALTAQTIGGDVDVKSLADLSYYQDKFFGGLRVPKQYFGVTNDNAGFSGGESLSIISSRYAKMVKRIQSTILQALTDAINILLLDRGLTSYANEFTLRMQAPMTSEEKDRRDNASSRINLVTDIMNTLSDIEDIPSKLKILKSLLSTAITNVEVIDIIQKEIDKLEEE
nr:MAG TPA: capsid assembly protein [Bacteriophage sp.]